MRWFILMGVVYALSDFKISQWNVVEQGKLIFNECLLFNKCVISHLSL